MSNRPIRSAQVISPFGVGAMMDFPGPESLIQAGLDAWPRSVTSDKTRRIENEGRLAKSLNVDFFVTPPPFDVNKPHTKLPWLRFPRWHFCPRSGCGSMKRAKFDDQAPPVCDEHGKKRPKMLQMRFVAACANGHLRDFPWQEWLASKNAADMGLSEIRIALDNGARLRLKNTGEAGGAGIRIELVRLKADNGKDHVLAYRTLAGVFGGNPADATDNATPLSRIGVKCRGENPAIAISPEDERCKDCAAPLLVVLRGAGNLYFADLASSIHIPDRVPGKLPDDLLELFENDSFVAELLYEASRSPNGKLEFREAKRRLLHEYPWIDATRDLDAFVNAFNAIEPLRALCSPSLMEKLRQLKYVDALDSEGLKQILTKIPYQDESLGRWDTVPDGLLERVFEQLEGKNAAPNEADESLGLRADEFKVFSQKRENVEGMPKSILKIRSHPLADYDDIVSQNFEHVSLLDTLRETRVLKGFSRLYARNRSPEEYRKLLWADPPGANNRWLPATMVYGEGIFLRFRTETLAQWERDHADTHRGRLEHVSRNMADLAHRRGVAPDSSHPRRAMIHTFAHLMINQLIFGSGYGSSSLRERLYFSEPLSDIDPGMAGVLIYTAAGDSEGSMGGLVRMGEPGKLEGVIRRALENALWCSSDPVCIESHGQGPDNCNLAACHSCGLLPETSCENQNRLLDRGTVVGTLERPDCGYFSSMCRT